MEYRTHTDEEIQGLIKEGFEKLDIDFKSTADAVERSGWFLKAKLILIEKRYEVSTKAGMSKAYAKAEFAEALDRQEIKSISGKKEYATKDEEFVARTIKSTTDQSELSRIDDIIDTFSNAHIMYRRMIRE